MIFNLSGHLEPWLWTAETWAGLQFIVLFVAPAVGLFQLREQSWHGVERVPPSNIDR